MSVWRRKASETLPELQRVIASREVASPMRLWIELNTGCASLWEQEPPPVELLRRLWQYADWCLRHPDGEVSTGAALGFCEHLLDTPRRAELLPQIMGKADFAGIRSLLEYHNPPETVEARLRTWPR